MTKLSKDFFNNIITYTLAIIFIPIILGLIIFVTELIYNFTLNFFKLFNAKSDSSFINEYTIFYLLILLLLGSVIIIWKLPKRQLKMLEIQEENDVSAGFEKTKEKLKLEDDIRKTIIQVIGGCFVVATVYISYVSYDQARKVRNSEQVSKALDALKDNSISTAGVFLLEKVSLNSPEDSGTVIKVLCSHLQEKSEVGKERTISSNTFKTAISAIIKLSYIVSDDIDLSGVDFSKLDLKFDESFPKNVNLSSSNLSGVKLNNVDLGQVILTGAIFTDVDLSNVKLGKEIENLSGANLRKVRLYSYDLSPGESFDTTLCVKDGLPTTINCELKTFKENANLSKTDLTENRTLASSQLRKVNLSEAKLINVVLTNANLTGANLTGANLTGVTLFNVDLSKSEGITKEQIESILINEETKLPKAFADRRDELLRKTKLYLDEQVRNADKSIRGMEGLTR